MKWDEYISEIELIKKQNNREYDLYTVIANVLRERKAFKNFSLRFVGNHTRTESTKLFWGLRGFPDFIVLARDFVPLGNEINKNKLFCAVEAKAIGSSILENGNDDLNKDQKQLIGHLLWFNKVIYTNGLEWRFYENPFEEVSPSEIAEYQNSSFKTAFKYVKEKNKTEEEIKEENKKISEAEEDIDKFLKKCGIEKLQCDKFILCKEDESKNVWDYKEWKKLVKYLNKYSFVS